MPELESNPMQGRAVAETYEPAPRVHPAHAEGTFTRIVEQQTAKVPSSVFLVLALGSMAMAAAFELADQQRWSRFVGMWAPTLLIAGVYNKIVKSSGVT
jgi:hypothetical protein